MTNWATFYKLLIRTISKPFEVPGETVLLGDVECLWEVVDDLPGEEEVIVTPTELGRLPVQVPQVLPLPLHRPSPCSPTHMFDPTSFQ